MGTFIALQSEIQLIEVDNISSRGSLDALCSVYHCVDYSAVQLKGCDSRLLVVAKPGLHQIVPSCKINFHQEDLVAVGRALTCHDVKEAGVVCDELSSRLSIRSLTVLLVPQRSPGPSVILHMAEGQAC